MEQVISQYWQPLVALVAFSGFLYTIKNDTKSTRSELRAHAEATTESFKVVNGRLDKVNGRIEKGEDRMQDQGERIAKLEA